jgi:sporulation protein YqfC
VILLSDKLQRIKESMITKLDLPREMILDLPKVTIISNSEFSIENHKGVIYFGESEIRIRTSIGIVNILGSNFEIIFVGGSTIALSGKFKSVVFKENE